MAVGDRVHEGVVEVSECELLLENVYCVLEKKSRKEAVSRVCE